jgi:hypothetical protein
VIDVWGVVANGLWIAGLALLLATVSWASWVASTQRPRLRTVLAWPATQRALDLGLVLFCAGLAATSRTRVEQVVGGVLALGWAVEVIWRSHTGRKQPRG